MNRARKIFPLFLANLGLFFIGVIIVYMFLEHHLFYQLGLPLLILIGAIMVFVTLRLILFFVRFQPESEKGTDIILFTEEEAEMVLAGQKTQKVLIGDLMHIRKGRVLDAKKNITDKKPFAIVRVKRIRIKNFEDITKEDYLKEGCKSKKELKRDLQKCENRTINNNSRVTLVIFTLDE